MCALCRSGWNVCRMCACCAPLLFRTRGRLQGGVGSRHRVRRDTCHGTHSPHGAVKLTGCQRKWHEALKRRACPGNRAAEEQHDDARAAERHRLLHDDGSATHPPTEEGKQGVRQQKFGVCVQPELVMEQARKRGSVLPWVLAVCALVYPVDVVRVLELLDRAILC